MRRVVILACGLAWAACSGDGTNPGGIADADTDADSDVDPNGMGSTGDTGALVSSGTGSTADTGTLVCIGFVDADGDGHGDPDRPTEDCSLPWSTLGDDCNDTSAVVFPGAPERVLSDGDCDGVNDTSIEYADYVFVASGRRGVDHLWAVGDVDGDGITDLVAGSGGDPSRLYLLLGANLVPGVIDVDTSADALIVLSPNEYFVDVAGADVDGDGLSDLVVGRPYAHIYVGEVRIFLGASIGAGGGVSYRVGDADHLLTAPTSPMSPTGRAQAGNSVTSLGDLDGDGRDDLLIGAPWSIEYAEPGAAHVVLGSQLTAATMSLDQAAYVLRGEEADDNAGYSVANGGDVNGDGVVDLLIGANNALNFTGTWGRAGRVYVVSGAGLVPGETSLSSADHILAGEVGRSLWGLGLESAGDVDGDGLDDLLIGGVWDPEYGKTDFVRVVYASELTSQVLSLDPTVGWTIPANDPLMGHALGSGDLDGDGLSDVWAGAVGDGYHTGGPGSLSVVLGKDVAKGPPTTWSVLVDGEAAVGLGGFAGSMPDFDGDGRDEVIVGNGAATFLILSKL